MGPDNIPPPTIWPPFAVTRSRTFLFITRGQM
jgi:hypothetical protein